MLLFHILYYFLLPLPLHFFLELQDRLLDDGITISETMGTLCEKWGKELMGNYGYSGVGAVVGALSGLGAATVYNARHRKEGMELTWSDKALEGFALEALLLYLAIAHFGRGRGAWRAAESPPEWKDQLQKLLSENDFGFEHLRDNPTSAQPSLVHHVDGILRKIFESLYGRGA